MPTMVVLTCTRCGKSFERRTGEVNRARQRRTRIFCSLSCAAATGNAPKKAREIIKVCPYCSKRFRSSTHNKAASFCSRSCASRGSMTAERRHAQQSSGKAHASNLISPEESLRLREAWKYAIIEKVLSSRPHEFEYRVGTYIFDLALLDTKTLIEFDGEDHNGEPQKSLDRKKDQAAERAGFIVIRRPVVSATVIDPETIAGV